MTRNRCNGQQRINLKNRDNTNNTNDTKKHIHKCQTERNKELYMHKVSRNLFSALRITPDDSLVLLLGTGSEKNNLEALTTWERLNFEHVESYPPLQQLSILMSKLRDQLESLDYQ